MKNILLTIEDFFNIPTAEIFNPDSFKNISKVSTDTRDISAGCLFAALVGNNFDGHSFIDAAIQNNAAAILINRDKITIADNLDIPFIVVEDTTKALGEIAKIWRRKLKAKIIGITGSAGKTSTKEILAALLETKFVVNKTIANNNNHIGVPLSILSTNEKHNILIAELGTNHFGEIAYSAPILNPDISIITNIGDSHLEFFKERKGVLKEKKTLFDITKENNGTVFINNDDKLITRIAKNYPNVISYGFSKGSLVKGEIIGYTDEGKPNINIKYKEQEFTVKLPLYGVQSAINFLAASAIALSLGLSEKDILKGANKLKCVPGRLDVLNLNSKILIDDTYNANPSSMAYAVSVLTRIKLYPRKIVILGDMFELGERGKQLHIDLAKNLKRSKIDEVYTIGTLMKNLNEALKPVETIKKRHFAGRSALKNYLSQKDFSNSVILVKGSHGMNMNEFVNIIKES